MQYFAGSLSNPQIPSGKDNRNRSPFDSFHQGGTQPVSQRGMPLQPRNEAFSLPPILNPSPAYQAFAIPRGVSPYLQALQQMFSQSR